MCFFSLANFYERFPFWISIDVTDWLLILLESLLLLELAWAYGLLLILLFDYFLLGDDMKAEDLLLGLLLT